MTLDKTYEQVRLEKQVVDLTAKLEAARKDAERYAFAAANLVLAGGSKFGWPIAPVGRSEWDRYIDAAMKGAGDAD